MSLPDSAHNNAASFFVDRHLINGNTDKTAIFDGGDRVSYAKLAQCVNQAGNYLRALGVRPEQRVILALNDSPEFVYFFFAALKIGAVAVPVNTFCNPDLLAFYANDARACVLVTQEVYADKCRLAVGRATPFLGHVVYIEDGGWREEPATLDPFPVCGDDSAFWLYTSGSTGVQKGVIHSHEGMIACAQSYGRDVLCIHADDRCYSASKLFFAYGLGNSIIFPFSAGAACILNSARSEPDVVLGFIKQYKPTLFFAVPTLYNQLLSAPQLDRKLFAGVRMCVSAGEYLPELVLDAWHRRTGKLVYDGIGTTEAMHIFCSNRPDACKPGTSGVPVEGYELKIVDQHDMPVPVNEVGRLLVRGRTLAKGYWNRADMSRKAFQGEWLATGDIYQRTDDGYFRYIGRQDDVFKSSGLWVSPGEVEQALLSHRCVKEAAVVAIKSSIRLTTAKAFIVLKDDVNLLNQELLKQELFEYLSDRLSKYKVPAAIEILSALPKTPTGKVARGELRHGQEDGVTAPPAANNNHGGVHHEHT